MSASPAGPSPDPRGYIRGGGGVTIHTRRVLGAVAAVCIVVLLSFVVELTISASRGSAQLTTLRHQGVPVQVTVTGCLGIGSGVGMGVEYWKCRGSYSLGGETYNEVIHGSRSVLDPGLQIPAIAVPGQPTLLTTVSGVARAHSGWTRYVVPVLLGVAAIGIVLGWLLLSRRHRRRPQSRASNSLEGETHNEVIHGGRSILDAGVQIPALVVPGQPTLMTAVSGVTKAQPGWSRYVVSALLGVAAIGMILGGVLLSRRHRSRSQRGQPVSAVVG